MTDYKRAVELADGFELRGHMVMANGRTDMWLDNPSQMHKDALAAQLVRQVDAAGGYAVVVKAASTAIFGANDPPIFKHVSYANDRTDNTINAILESKVLEPAECKHPTALSGKNGLYCSECGEAISNPDEYCDPV